MTQGVFSDRFLDKEGQIGVKENKMVTLRIERNKTMETLETVPFGRARAKLGGML